MNKIFLKAIVITACFLMVPSVIFAHQPNYENTNILVEIKNPDISQAFYGELQGQPAVYKINTTEQLTLYTGLLVPDLKDSRVDFTLDIYDSQNKLIKKLESSSWGKYFEEFARDDYLKGPDYKAEVQAGNYTLVLLNPQNQGKYVLVVGEKENFSLLEMPKTFEQLIKVKVNTFNKPWYSAFINIFGGVIAGIVLAIVLLAVVLYKLIFKKTLKHKLTN